MFCWSWVSFFIWNLLASGGWVELGLGAVGGGIEKGGNLTGFGRAHVAVVPRVGSAGEVEGVDAEGDRAAIRVDENAVLLSDKGVSGAGLGELVFHRGVLHGVSPSGGGCSVQPS